MKKNGPNILLVEDNPGDVKLTLRLIKKFVFYENTHCDCVATLFEALNRIEENNYDIILLDLSLPDTNGEHTIIKNFTTINDFAPLIVLTGNNSMDVGMNAVKAGAQDFLNKDTLNSILLEKSISYAIERHKMSEIIKHMALVDQLTSLYNRNGFRSMSNHKLALAKRKKINLFLIFIDLDRMKEINDTYGHDEGDNALADTAIILRDTLRATDVIGRLGGDEFVALVVDDQANDGNPLSIKRIKEATKEFNKIENRKYQLSLSCGAAYFNPDKTKTIAELIALADQKMYEDKKARKMQRQ